MKKSKFQQLSREQQKKLTGGMQSTSFDQCGPGVGSCAVSVCCSAYGWCGTTPEYCCASKGCQGAYGACNDNC